MTTSGGKPNITEYFTSVILAKIRTVRKKYHCILSYRNNVLFLITNYHFRVIIIKLQDFTMFFG
jgi:hypothetical protein